MTTSSVRWYFQPAILTKRVLARIAHVEEVVLIPDVAHESVSADERKGCGDRHSLMLLVYRAHQCRSWRQGFLHKYENGFLWRKLDPLADYVDELAYG